jgi:hypothetical protein
MYETYVQILYQSLAGKWEPVAIVCSTKIYRRKNVSNVSNTQVVPPKKVEWTVPVPSKPKQQVYMR